MAQKIALGQRYYNFGFTDSLLFTEAYMRPRYKGSKLIGAKINEYTDYSQLTAEEYTARFNNTIPPSLGGGIFPQQGVEISDYQPEFIRTTKPMDGSIPPLFDTYTNNTNPKPRYSKQSLKGNYIPFPAPGTAYVSFTGGALFTSPINSKQDLFNQDGSLIGAYTFFGPIVNRQVGNALMAWECQYMGGYRRDRSYGKNPVIEVKTNTIYEFDWGGSAYPEVEKGGSVHIKQILNVDSYSKGLPNVYIVNEATNDSFRINTSITNGQGANIVLTDNPGEETDFSINFKRSLAFGDRITLNSYIAGNELVEGPEIVVGNVNEIIEEINAVPTKNVITLEPGIGVPSYTGIYTQRKLGTESNFTSSLTGEPVGVPYLPKYEETENNYVPDTATTNPNADFYMADFQNPGGPDVLASTLRNVSGSYYYPSIIPSLDNPGVVQSLANNSKGKGIIILNQNKTKYLKIDPNGIYMTGSVYVNDSSVYTELSSSLANNNRHFVSFYSSLGNVARGDLNQIGEPVEINSVALDVSNANIYLKSTPPITGVIGDSGEFGMLIWKAQQGPFAIIKPTDTTTDYSYKYLRTGGFYREYSTLTIKQHFDDIVKTVGMKPNL